MEIPVDFVILFGGDRLSFLEKCMLTSLVQKLCKKFYLNQVFRNI